MKPHRLASIIATATGYAAGDASARKFIELLHAEGHTISKVRKLGRFEFMIYYDHQVLDGATGFTTPAGAWAYVRDELGAQLCELSQLKQMGYSVKRVKKVGF